MAKISTIKDALLICKEANITPFIWGHRGLGKSSLVRQLAEDNGWGFCDLRCSQLESSDIRGLPDRGADNRTHYLPPADMPIGDMDQEQIVVELAKMLNISVDAGTTTVKLASAITKKLDGNDLDLLRRYEVLRQSLQPRFARGILFLDEVNRAQDDVLQAIFQLILDRRIGQYVLPPGWCVVAAGNFTEGYRVGGFDDPAFLNRFCHLTLSGGETTLEEWVNYMSAAHGGDASEIIEFASQNTKHLDGDIKGELGFSIQPSRRSWEMMTRVSKVIKNGKYSDEAKIEVSAGLIGRELAQVFSRYSCPVKPRDLLSSGVKPYETQLRKLSRNELTGLMWGLVSFCKTKIDEEKIATVCLDFAEFMVHHASDKDVVVAFCRALVTSNDTSRAQAAVISNPQVANMIAKFNAKAGNTKKSFVDYLVSRPALQSALSNVSWGVVDKE